jgi:hypothetical protein
LRGVHQRQELRRHDEALAARLLQAPPESAADAARFLDELSRLDGHHDELDQLIVAARAGDLLPAQRERLTAALQRIAGACHAEDLAQVPMAK